MKYNDFMANHEFKSKLHTSILDGDGFLDSILIEGDKDSLNFLADLIKAFANDDGEVKAAISPDGAGLSYFAKGAKFGIYLHKIK